MNKKLSFNIKHFGHFSSSLHYSLKSHDIIFKFLDIKLSWKEASDLCKEFGGYLPYFTSQHHLEEFLAFFKLSEVISPMAQIFIGLRSNTSKVSFLTNLVYQLESFIQSWFVHHLWTGLLATLLVLTMSEEHA